MGAPPKVQPIFLLALPRESLDTLYSWVRHLKYSLCLFAVTTESLGYTALMGAPPKVQPISDICKLYQRKKFYNNVPKILDLKSSSEQIFSEN